MQIQYLINAKSAAIEDNPKSILTLAERFDTLRRHEHAWRNFIVGNQKSITGRNRQSRLYDFSAGIYVQGETVEEPIEYPTTALRCITLSPHASCTQENNPWTRISVNRDIMDFGLAVMEHDLIALVTSRPKDLSYTCVTELILLNISTGKYHTLATQPVIYVTDREPYQGRCSVMLEVVGDHLALLLIYNESELDDYDMLYLYDWRSGSLKTTLATSGAYESFIFLTEDDILLPNRRLGCLEIFTFSGTNFVQKCSLGLPQLKPHHVIWTLGCRAEPNPTGVRSGVGLLFKSSTTLPYISSAVDAIAFFDIVIQQGVLRERFFSFVVHRSSLLKFIEMRPQPNMMFEDSFTSSPSMTNQIVSTVSIPWKDWGPLNTRWFNTDSSHRGYITITAGQRYVRIPSSDQFASISVLDFNKYNVQRYKKSLEDPPLTSNNDIKDSSTWGTKTLVNHATLLRSSSIFAEEVWSALPYIEVQSRELYDYSAVLMDEEHILGIRFSGPHSDEIDILHMQ